MERVRRKNTLRPQQDMGPQGGVYIAGQLGISENTPICGQAYWFYVQVGPMVADIGCGVAFQKRSDFFDFHTTLIHTNWLKLCRTELLLFLAGCGTRSSLLAPWRNQVIYENTNLNHCIDLWFTLPFKKWQRFSINFSVLYQSSNHLISRMVCTG